VLGSRQTAAAGFVERFQNGAVVNYDGEKLRSIIDRICDRAVQVQIRSRSADLAPHFSATGVGQWILDSLDRGYPTDVAMEELMPRGKSAFAYFIEDPTPREIVPDFVSVYHGLSKIQRQKYCPDFIIDVGASTGIWSYSVHKIFPNARLVLLEPLLDLYGERVDYLKKALPKAEILPLALGEVPGKADFRVSSDLYGSSLFAPADGRNYQTIPVTVSTLDLIAKDLELTGRGILKLDVQGAEHLVLAGGAEFLKQVDVLIVELSMYDLAGSGKTFEEMYSIISGLGFRYYDDVGDWRSAIDGRLLQKDVLFVRKELFPLSDS
jgi:FkbM family methyltransferase